LGLRSIREPARPDTSKSAAGGGLIARVAATQAPAEPVAVDAQAALGDKGRAVNGSAGAATTAATAPAKQAESTPAAKTEHVEVRGAEAKTAAVAATPTAAAAKVEVHAADPAMAAAGTPKPSLEEAVAEMLRPMLSTWLDANLARIVQDVVREQMAKAPLPGTDKPAG
jgi:cell pole-organizing protein PopZ